MGNGGAERARPVRSGSLENLDLAAGGFWHTAVHTLSELGELGGLAAWNRHYTIMSLPKQGPRVGFCIVFVFATHSELWFTRY